MTHDKNALYYSEKSPTTFTKEMLELKDEIKEKTGHETNLCRAPYGKKGTFKAAHYKLVEEAGLYCVDWHVDSQDWAKKNANQIYDEVVNQLENAKGTNEVVLLFHELQRTIDAMPAIIDYLTYAGYTFEPYVEGKIFEGLS
jgi:peptidoglycan/xylan/chitin deacetylase (PgdA/CDA1 family)